MDARTRWRRLDAEHWIHVFGIVGTTVLVLWTVWAVPAGIAAGPVVVAVFPAAIAALAGWLTSAWRRERPWSWWVWTALATVGLLSGLSALAQLRLVAIPWCVVSGGLLLLLVHPDSRARTEFRAPSPPLRR
jgi:hypothetical protein